MLAQTRRPRACVRLPVAELTGAVNASRPNAVDEAIGPGAETGTLHPPLAAVCLLGVAPGGQHLLVTRGSSKGGRTLDLAHEISGMRGFQACEPSRRYAPALNAAEPWTLAAASS